MDEAAIQCGFCTPGFILTAVEILESGKEYTDDELRKLLSGHLCRCTHLAELAAAVGISSPISTRFLTRWRIFPSR